MPAVEDIDEPSLIGRTVGVYELVEEVGRGGMGTVYRASRSDGEFDQTVAIKLIKRGMDTDAILRRFRRERQILATLDHPNIAYFLSGGSTEEGLPYFVMEYVTGRSLYKYCDENKLSIRERLAIFRQICWAVAVAHEKQIVHRDLKPSNILVTSDGKPKLLDFGIAKTLDSDIFGTDADPTATHLRAMTPEYASPEQAAGDFIGPASDIYSLGILLYELITGHRPYRLSKKIHHEIERVIREEIPTNPSGSITREADLVPVNGGEITLAKVFEGRNATPSQLKREIEGDLDKVILKALRKAPEERYRSAIEFADDITNYLEGRPVKADLSVTMRSLSRPSNRSKLAIGILPFSYSGNSESGEQFVGIGMADALVSRLSTVRRLVVRPTTSVLGLSGVPADEAAEQLGVDFLLEGRVRIAGSRIRVSVMLYDTHNSSSEWARTFDRDVGDVLEVEDSIAEDVSRALLKQLTEEEQARLGRRNTNDPAAYEAYLRGRFFWSKFSDEGLQRAVGEFQKAIELDPDYVLPHLGLAEYYIWSAIFGELPSNIGFPKAQEAARHAIEIDDTYGDAYAALGFTVLLYDWNWEESELLLKRALELNPNSAVAHEFYSNWLLTCGRFDDAIAEIKKAEELDPVSPRAILMTSWTLYQCRQFDEAVRSAEKAFSMQPDLPQSLLHLGNTLMHTSQLERSIKVLRKSSETWRFSGLPRYMLAFARRLSGDSASAQTIYEKMQATAKTAHVKQYFLGMSAVAAGEIDNAFEHFEQAINERNEWLVWFATDPKLDAIRSDPRCLAILSKMRHPLAERTDRFPTDPHTISEREHSIAVLPFKVLTASETVNTDDEYLSIGIADAITMRLSNVRRFLVRPTSSVLPFAGTSIDPFAAGKQLKVDFIVDGLIRRIGDTIRVTAQLLAVEEGSTRWSASFSEPIKDLLEFEDAISDQVTRKLLPKLSATDEVMVGKRGTNVPLAHDEYLQGRYFWNLFTPASFPRSIEHFRRAVELDPNYALAHVGIADYFTWATIYGLFDPRVAMPEVLEYASRALAIDPTLAEAHAAMGLYHSNMQDSEKAETLYRHAIELNPNYDLAHEWLSSLLVGTGKTEEGVAEIRIAERLNPLSNRPKILSAWTLYQARYLDEALAKANELIELSPDLMQSYLQSANILTEIGRHDEAVKCIETAIELEPESPLHFYVACFVYVRAGRHAEAEALLQKWEAIASSRYIPPYFLGLSHLAVGNVERGFELLTDAVDEKTPWALWIGTEPKFDAFRELPAYQALLASTKNPIASNQTGKGV